METLFNIVNNPWFFYSLIGLLIVYILGLNLILTIWTALDIRHRTENKSARILAPIFVLFFNFAGFIPYVALRPHQTLEEKKAEQRDLLLMAEATRRYECPKCHAAVEANFALCPFCKTKFRSVCECMAVLEKDWKCCPYCGKSQIKSDKNNQYLVPKLIDELSKDLSKVLSRKKEPQKKAPKKSITLRQLLTLKK